MSAKGRIVIPSEMRRKFGLKKGARIHVDMDEQARRFILTPITREYVRSLCGKYRGKGLLKALALEKNRSKKT